MRVLLCLMMVLGSVFVLGCGDSGPSDELAQSKLAEYINEYSDGYIELTSFSRQGALVVDEEDLDNPSYEMSYEGEITFTDWCYWHTGRGRRGPEIFRAADFNEGKPSSYFSPGAARSTIKISGRVELRRDGDSWELVDVDAKAHGVEEYVSKLKLPPSGQIIDLD